MKSSGLFIISPLRGFNLHRQLYSILLPHLRGFNFQYQQYSTVLLPLRGFNLHHQLYSILLPPLRGFNCITIDVLPYCRLYEATFSTTIISNPELSSGRLCFQYQRCGIMVENRLYYHNKLRRCDIIAFLEKSSRSQ